MVPESTTSATLRFDIDDKTYILDFDLWLMERLWTSSSNEEEFIELLKQNNLYEKWEKRCTVNSVLPLTIHPYADHIGYH